VTQIGKGEFWKCFSLFSPNIVIIPCNLQTAEDETTAMPHVLYRL